MFWRVLVVAAAAAAFLPKGEREGKVLFPTYAAGSRNGSLETRSTMLGPASLSSS